jgi:predicted O-methyltransferase YrrM
MSLRFHDTSDDLYRYMLDVSVREPDLLEELREETRSVEGSDMQTPPEAGQFLFFLTRLLEAERALEVGVYTGYSSLRIARALPPEGQLVACDVSETWTRIARRYWQRAGLADRVDLRLGPALDTMDDLLDDGAAGTFDLIFLDADKERYVQYYERAYDLVRQGGLVVVDNVLWAGRVADPSHTDDETAGIRRLNERIREDDRVEHSLVPIGDGYSLVRKPDGAPASPVS